jgi:transposase
MIATIQEKCQQLVPMMHEKLKRRWAACEAIALGRGGISAVSEATGISRTTIRKAVREINAQMPEIFDDLQDRVRQPGGGRRRLVENDPQLAADLRELLEATTRGDPTCSLLWTCKSTRKLAQELNARGHHVSHMTVSRLLPDLGYSLQGNRKTREGSQHPDRDAQFQYINQQVKRYRRRRQPVISVDAKNRELVGDFHNSGREWRRRGHPEKVRTHDFPDKELGKVTPYGVYDETDNSGWVSVGIDHNTAQFAVETIRRWWQQMGRQVHPEARELLITADSGGNNGSRSRLWKVSLQELANDLGLKITVCHFPPGTSKWNYIEHRMFCHITENWRGRPLVSRSVVVNLIAHTTTSTGLNIEAELDDNAYPTGIEVNDEQLAALNIKPHTFHGNWNYTLSPII